MVRTIVASLFAALLAASPVTTLARQAPAADTDTKAAPAVVNLNTATQSQLESLPGIGARTAQRILEYRQKNGSFKKIEELMNVKGIGEKSFLRLKSHITVAAAK